MRSRIIGCGSYLPDKVITNHDLEKMVATTDDWIVERTGIKKRHVAAEGELTSDLACKASLNAIQNAKINKDNIDLIIVATTTPDNTFPATATKLQALLGIDNTVAFDIQAVCSGFLYGLATADNFIRSGTYKTVLLVGADSLSRIVDWQDRTTCVLFGDGAGAVILEAYKGDDKGILHTELFSDGKARDILYVDGGAARGDNVGKIRMSGQEVFKFAVSKLYESTLIVLDKAKLNIKDIDWVVPHQANIRILEATARKLGIPFDKVISTVDVHANTSAASIPLALDFALQQKKINPGQLVLFQAIGAGMTWGVSLIRW